MSDFKVKWKRPRRVVPELELDSFPATPAGYYTGYYPASKAVEANKVTFDINVQLVPELNRYQYFAEVTAWQSHFEKTRNSTRRRLKQPLELNTYPVSGVVEYYPAYKEQPSFKINFRRNNLTSEELNTYPASPDVEYYPAYAEQPSFRINFRREHLKSDDLNSYPQTPAAYYDGYYPGSKLAESHKVSFKQNIQTLPEHNVYPLATSIAVLTAFIEPKSFRIKFKRKHLEALEVNEYQAGLAGCSESLLSMIQTKGESVSSTISDTGQSVTSTIDPTEGLLSMIQTKGKSVTSTIDSTGISVRSTLCP